MASSNNAMLKQVNDALAKQAPTATEALALPDVLSKTAACLAVVLIAAVPGADWPALDLREAAYVRAVATHQVRHTLPHQPEIAVYTIPEGQHGSPTTAHPILLSYIDVVVQGYLREFGEGGVQRLFDTTHGWDAPILDDRAAPRYPRHQPLGNVERNLTDAHLDRLGVRVSRGTA